MELTQSTKIDSKTGEYTKIGDYSTIDINDLFSAPIKQTKQKRAKKTKDVVHSVFSQMAEITTDPQWKILFTKASCGKFPQGFTCKNSVLYFRKKNKVEKLDISGEMENVLPQTMKFFRIYGGYSNQDEFINIFEYLMNNKVYYENWKDIRSKNTKEFFIDMYIDELIEKFDLTKIEVDQLKDNLNLGFSTKMIDSKNVIFENMKIKNITNLQWDTKSRKFIIDGTPKYKTSTRKKQIVKKDSYLYGWLSYNCYSDKEIEKIFQTKYNS